MLKTCARAIRFSFLGLLGLIYISALTSSSSWTGPSRADVRNPRSAPSADATLDGSLSRQPESLLMKGKASGPGGGVSTPWARAAIKASLASPMVATVTATKTATIVGDDGDGKADPGETIMYTVTITNNSGSALNNVVFSDMVDPNTTYTAGSLAASPIAVNDTYNTIGNVPITISAAQGVIQTNDLNPNGSGTLEVTKIGATNVPSGGMATGATTNGGSVTMHSDGSFDFTPAVGSTANDTFIYTLGNGTGKTDTATVTINIAGRIWFVNSAAATNGDGRLNTPFKFLTGAGSADTVDAANDVIFLYTSGTNYTGGITLNNGEIIIGQGASQSILTITGFTAPSGSNLLPATGNASDPIITTAGTTAITLNNTGASGTNGLYGFTVGDTGAAGTDIAGATFGTVTIKDVSVKGTGRALSLATGTIASGSTFDLIETTGGDSNEGVKLATVGGSFTSTTTNIVNPTLTGIDVQSAPAGSSFSFGGTTVNKGSTSGTGLNLTTNSGTISFSSLAVTTSAGVGLTASGGTVNVTTGSITSNGNANASPGAALNITAATTLGMTFTTVSSTNSSTTGINLVSVTGSLAITTTSISNSSGVGISETGSSANVNYGTTTVSGSGGTSVVLGTSGAGNTGTITFGSFTLTPDANQRGLFAQDNTNTITITSGSVTASGAVAVEITKSSGATPLQIALGSVADNGGANGIKLNNISGSFVVSGDGSTANSGGIIQNTASVPGTLSQNGTGAVDIRGGQSLTATFKFMKVLAPSGNGFMVTNTTGTTLIEKTTIDHNNANITNSFAVRFENHSSNATLTLDGCLIDNKKDGGTAVAVSLQDTANVTFNIQDSNPGDTFDMKFTNLFGSGVIVAAGDNTGASGTATVDVSNAKFVAPAANGVNNLEMTTQQNSVLNYNIHNNTFDTPNGATFAAGIINVNATGSGRIGSPNNAATIQNNTLSNSGIDDTFIGYMGIRIAPDNCNLDGSPAPCGVSTVTHRVLIQNNTITNFFQRGVYVSARGKSIVQLQLLGNTIGTLAAAVGRSNRRGVEIETQAASSINATINGNTIVNEGTSNSNSALAIRAGTDNGEGSANGTINATVTNNTIKNNTSAGTGGWFRAETINLGSGVSAGNICLDYSNNTLKNSADVADASKEFNLVHNSTGTFNRHNGGGNVGTETIGAGSIGSVASCTLPSFASVPSELTAANVGTSDDAQPMEDALSIGDPKAGDPIKLSTPELLWMAQAAVERWRQAEISADALARLQAVTFELADLPAGQVASANGTHVKIDPTAAGYGWYIDQSPQDDSEFTVGVPGRELQTIDISYAHDKIDLLTVLMRELGKVYLDGSAKTPKVLRPLMENTLAPGIRRLPDASQIQFVITQLPVWTPPARTTGALDSSLAANQESAGRRHGASAGKQIEGDATASRANAAKIPADVRYAVYHPAANQPTAANAVLKSGNANAAIAYRANRARRVTAFSPTGGPPDLGPFTLPAGESVMIMFSVVVNAANTFPPGTTQVCNQGTVNYTGGPAGGLQTDDPSVGGTADPTCLTLDAADLSVTKMAGAATVCSTSNITYTITYHNAGPGAAVNPIVSDVMPTGTTLVSATPPANWNRTDSVPNGGNGTITFTRASSANGENAVFTVVVGVSGSVADGTVLSNTANVTSSTPDTNPSNNTSSPATMVTVKTPPTTATVGSNQTVCALGTTTDLGGNTPTSGTGMWTVQSGGTGTFNPNATTPGATFTHTGGSGPIVLRWTISNSPCADSFAEVTITIKAQPTATVGGPQTICALGTTTALGGNTPSGGATGTWSIVTAGVTGTFNPNATTPGATFTHASGGIGSTITLRWTVSNAPCTDATADVTITVKEQPTASAGGPQTICALGTTTALGGNTPSGGATGTWSIVTAGVTGTFNPDANTPGATFTHTSGGVGTTITLRWTVTNAPCTAATADVSVTIKTAPTATAGGPQTICDGSTTASLGGNTPSGGATGMWSIVTGGATGTFNPDATTPGATFTPTSGPGTITLRWTVSNSPCSPATADVVITVKGQPTATVGGPQTICATGTTAPLGGNTPSGGATGTWSIVTAGVTGTFNPNATTPGATFTHTSGGIGTTIMLRWTVTNAPCTSAMADVSITIQPAPTASTGGPQTICETGTTTGLGGNTPGANETGTWSIVTGGATGTFTPNATTPNATFTPTSGAGTITLRWTVTNSTCSTSATADAVITVKQQPTATVGSNQGVCALGTTSSLGGNTPAGGATGMWTVQSGGAGTFNPNANTPGATFTHTAGSGPIVLRWTVSNAPCTDATAELTITVSQPPTTATAGGPQTICAGSTTAALGGNTPTSGTGMWSVVSGGAGTFNPNANTPGATFTHTGGSGPIVLRWTISNAPCPNSTADVTITITQPPTTATVGPNQGVCALGTTSSLGGNTPTSGTGMWTVQSGGTGTFNPNANTPGATFTHLTGTGQIVLRWTISNAPCPDSFAELTITISQSPTPATAGGPQTICAGSTTAALGGNTPTSGTGMWTIVTAGATGTFNPNANTPGATFTHTGGTGMITLRWTISSSPCASSSADVVITVTQPPTTAKVGSNQGVCALGTTSSLGGNTPTSGMGIWTVQSGGTGIFNPNAATPGATFTHTGGSGPIVLRWTISNAPCPDSFAELTITISQSPTVAKVGGPQTICETSATASLGGNTPSSGMGVWSIQSGGTGTFNPNANTPGATFTSTSGAGTFVLRWTISSGSCPDSFAEVTITVKQQPTASAGSNQTVCANGTTTGLGGNTPAGGATGVWSIQGGGTGTFNPNASTPNATFTHTGGSGPITLRWTVSNAPCSNATADVVITITQPPTTATAGPNQTIAPGGTTAGLGGNTPTSGTGQWTIVTAGATGTFNPNASTPNATFTHLTGTGQIVLRWTISNPPCPSSFANVTIQIGIAPTITCPTSPVVASAAAGSCAANVTFNVTATGVPTPTVTCTPPSGSSFPVGMTTVMCTASNGVAPDSTCSFTVKVNDTQPPVFTNGCPAAISTVTPITCPTTTTQTVTYATPAISDNCPGATVACVPPSGSVFATGTTSVTCTATDASGNTATCSFAVRVWTGCLQDESNPGNVCLFDAQTGDYQFCCNGVVIATGTATLTVRGCIVSFDHSKGNRRVKITADMAVKRGTATVIIANLTTCTITDQNMANNTCVCPVATKVAKP